MTILNNKRLKLTSLFCLFFVVALSSFFLVPAKAQLSEDVDIIGGVFGCELVLTVYPEKRYPATNNWSEDLTIEIIDSSNVTLATLTETSNSAGQVNVNLCDENILLTGDTYKFRIKGASHLRKTYTGISAFFTAILANVNLAGQGDLLAGETSQANDNVINALDISTVANNFYSGNVKNDLNRDGTVNVLDISIAVFNYLEEGN